MRSQRPLIVVPGDEPMMIRRNKRHLQRLRELGEVQVYDQRPKSDAEKIERARDAQILFNSRGIVRWPDHVLRELPKLKLIACVAIGVDCIDLATAGELGIVVCNVPGRTATIVAEHALALLLATARQMAWMTSEMKRGSWPDRLSTSLIGKRLGVIGTGNIGCEMIRLARALGMEVVAWSFHPQAEKAERLGFRYVQRDELLQTSDAVSLHVKLTDQSRRMIDAAALAQMKPGGLLVNTARGAVVDGHALRDALDRGHLAGAGLDVFETEPLPADDPLLGCQHVVLTPHSADHLPEGMDALCDGAIDNVEAFLNGQPENVVTTPSRK